MRTTVVRRLPARVRISLTAASTPSSPRFPSMPVDRARRQAISASLSAQAASSQCACTLWQMKWREVRVAQPLRTLRHYARVHAKCGHSTAAKLPKSDLPSHACTHAATLAGLLCHLVGGGCKPRVDDLSLHAPLPCLLGFMCG